MSGFETHDIPTLTRQDSQDADTIPFPSSREKIPGSSTKGENNSPESQSSKNSKQTSSDKLSALPTSTSNPNPNRLVRSPAISSSGILPNRGYRRSLDASASLPSFSNADFDSHNLWNANQSLNAHLNAGGSAQRGTMSADASLERDTPKQRVSFESERGSLPARTAFSRKNRGSDPVMPSPALRSSAYRDVHKEQDTGSQSPSHSRSRAASPLRIFQQWSAGLHRHRHPTEEPFIPIDPFKLKTQLRLPCFSLAPELPIHLHKHDSAGSPDTQTCDACLPSSSIKAFWNSAHVFLADTLPRQLYLNILLRLPAMYFSRVAKIFEDAEVSRPDIQRMIESGGGGSAFIMTSASEPATIATMDSGAARETPTNFAYPPGTLSPTIAAGIGLPGHVAASAMQMPLPFPDDWTPPLVSPALIRFKHSWEAFIDSLVREWKTLNVVSALLLSAILTIFQIQSAAEDPVTRTAALLSLICALMSLSYGCMYIVRFGTMRSMYRASKWAEEARKTNTVIWWNVWVLLAMPAIWMSWSMVLFIASILSFVWRTGSELDPAERPPLSTRASLGPRIAITGVFGIGMIYFALIVKTLRSYGTHTGGMALRKMNRGALEQTTSMRARDIDAAMERRGRERQRSASGPRRREDAPEAGRGFDREEGDRGKGGLRTMLGLGLVGLKDQGHGTRMDLEKAEGTGDGKDSGP